jgi:AcrR family transcriptional regulator
MPLKNSVRTERIVAAASTLFARQGYHGTSTREIARTAGVSENTLFRHFDNKEDLFWSALRSQSVELKPRWEQIAGIRSNESPTVVLPEILGFLANFLRDKPDVFRLFAVAFVEMQKDADAVCFSLLAPYFAELSRYLEANICKGHVLEVDATLLAASFMALVLIYPQLSKLRGDEIAVSKEGKDAVAVCSKFWLDLLSPRLPVQAGVPLCMGSES